MRWRAIVLSLVHVLVFFALRESSFVVVAQELRARQGEAAAGFPTGQRDESPPRTARLILPRHRPGDVPNEGLLASDNPAGGDRTGEPDAATLPLEAHAAAEGASAAPTSEPGAERTGRLTRLRLDDQMHAVQNAQGIAEADKVELLKRYRAASDWLASGEEAAKTAAQYDSEVQAAPQLIQASKGALSESAVKPRVQVPSGATLPQLEQLLAQAEGALSAAGEKLNKHEGEIKRRGERKGELTKLLEETKQRLEESNKQLAAAPPVDEAAEMSEARRTELSARILFLESQLVLFTSEAKRLDALAELFPLQRDLAKREKNFHELEVAGWQDIIARYRRRESERQAEEARRQVEMAHPALRDLAERNSELAEKRKLASDAITKTTDEVKENEKLLEQLERQYEQAEEKVEKAGHSSTVGLMLRKLRDELPNLRTCEARLRFVAREMPQVNLARIECDDERGALGDLEAATRQVLLTLSPSPSRPQSDSTVQQRQQLAQLKLTVHEMLTTKRDLLDKLVRDYDSYLGDLSELEVSNRNLIQRTRQLASYIGEHVLWIRSSDVLKPRDGPQAVKGLIALGNPKAWLEVVRSSGLDALRRPLSAMAVLLAALVLIVLHTRLGLRIRKLCESKSASVALRFHPTVEALLLAAIGAAQWPLLVAYFGWRMTISDRSGDLGLAVGSTMQYLAALCWFTEFIRQVCRAGGIAESHFGWSPYSLAAVRREMRWLSLLGIPLAALVLLAELFQQGEWADSLGRLAFIATLMLLISFAHSMLGSKEHLLREHVARNPRGWLDRVRLGGYALGIGVPALLAILAGFGYYYSAQQLSFRLQATLAMVLGLILLHAVISRWFLIKRRKLAMEQARLRQQQQSEAAASEAASPITVVVDQLPDLSAIHGQLRLLLQHAAIVSVLVGSWFIWSDVMPALRALDRVVLWETTVEMAESHEDAEGNLIRQKVPVDVPTTLRHGLLATLLLMATIVLGRNLPALLEITILNQLPFDKGGRHAASLIVRYGVALTGLLLACRTLSITWSGVQWLAAGMTVGLGFGLQEIFANFVSGLILLCERPIRVGDVITLDDVTGTVTDIRIRATTVTNWDRKELIVPNKELITGRLLNWTLSDTTNRIALSVGVAYRSDPEEVQRILLSIVQQHPNVLEDPPPIVFFDKFDESALNFVMFAYLASLDVRLATIHQLHCAIHQRLAEADIEIAFPQRDINVNVRSLEQLLTLPAAAAAAAGAGRSKQAEAA